MCPKADNSPLPFLLTGLVTSTSLSHKLYFIWCWQLLFLKAILNTECLFLNCRKMRLFQACPCTWPDWGSLLVSSWLLAFRWALCEWLSIHCLVIWMIKTYRIILVKNKNFIESDRWTMKLGQKFSLPCALSTMGVKPEEHFIPTLWSSKWLFKV